MRKVEIPSLQLQNEVSLTREEIAKVIQVKYMNQILDGLSYENLDYVQELDNEHRRIVSYDEYDIVYAMSKECPDKKFIDIIYGFLMGSLHPELWEQEFFVSEYRSSNSYVIWSYGSVLRTYNVFYKMKNILTKFMEQNKHERPFREPTTPVRKRHKDSPSTPLNHTPNQPNTPQILTPMHSLILQRELVDSEEEEEDIYQPILRGQDEPLLQMSERQSIQTPPRAYAEEGGDEKEIQPKDLSLLYASILLYLVEHPENMSARAEYMIHCIPLSLLLAPLFCISNDQEGRDLGHDILKVIRRLTRNRATMVNTTKNPITTSNEAMLRPLFSDNMNLRFQSSSTTYMPRKRRHNMDPLQHRRVLSARIQELEQDTTDYFISDWDVLGTSHIARLLNSETLDESRDRLKELVRLLPNTFYASWHTSILSILGHLFQASHSKTILSRHLPLIRLFHDFHLIEFFERSLLSLSNFCDSSSILSSPSHSKYFKDLVASVKSLLRIFIRLCMVLLLETNDHIHSFLSSLSTHTYSLLFYVDHYMLKVLASPDQYTKVEVSSFRKTHDLLIRFLHVSLSLTLLRPFVEEAFLNKPKWMTQFSLHLPKSLELLQFHRGIVARFPPRFVLTPSSPCILLENHTAIVASRHRLFRKSFRVSSLVKSIIKLNIIPSLSSISSSSSPSSSRWSSFPLSFIHSIPSFLWFRLSS